MTPRDEFKTELAALIAALIPDIADDYRASDDPEDDTPGMQITIGADKSGWSFQTGDNSFTGGAYGYAHWGVGSIYRDSKPEEVAEDLLSDLESQVWDEETKFFFDSKITDDQIVSMVCGYVECALWSSSDMYTDDGKPCEGEPRPLDDYFDRDDLTSEASAKMREHCADFARNNESDALAYVEAGRDWDHLGHDFWLTRNGHGAGFWDRGMGALGDRLTAAAKVYGSAYLYVGDDGKIHHFPESSPHRDNCTFKGKDEWSGSPNPANPSNEWICDGCGAIIPAA